MDVERTRSCQAVNVGMLLEVVVRKFQRTLSTLIDDKFLQPAVTSLASVFDDKRKWVLQIYG